MNFLAITIFMVLAVMSPGPDFALVTRNSLNYNKKIGVYTSMGIACGAMLLSAFSIIGVVFIITRSVFLFNVIKLVGGVYLVYLGYGALMAAFKNKNVFKNGATHSPHTSISNIKALKQGLYCSTLNPKAMLFFTALFTIIIHNTDYLWVQVLYGVEISLLYLIWFVLLAILIAHEKVKAVLVKIYRYINLALGLFLMLLGIHILSVMQF